MMWRHVGTYMCSEARQPYVSEIARWAEPHMALCEARQSMAGITLAACEGQMLKLWQLPI